MKPLKIVLPGLLFAAAGLLAAQAPETVRVAAAANLASVGPALQAAFEARNPSVKLEFVYGASGTLTTQIQAGAPYQLFLSADTEFPAKLADAGLTTAPPRVYALGKLVLLSTKPFDTGRGLAVLADPAWKQFALANPDLAPYGRAARQALQAAGLWDQVSGKAVVAQTITQAVQYTVGATGIGLVNRSAVGALKDVFWQEVDPKLYEPIDQGFVVLKSAADLPGVKAFAAFLTGAEARAVFVQAGYAVP